LSIRWRSFLTLAALCIAPLLVLSLGALYGALKYANRLLEETLQHDTREVEQQFKHLVNERDNEMMHLAHLRPNLENSDQEIKDYVSTLPQ
jgi:hypothetical protein